MFVPILTGLAAGAVHVIGGADHLVAMAPFSLNRPLAACRSALGWGAGHSAGVIVLALIAIGIKDLAHVEAISSWAGSGDRKGCRSPSTSHLPVSGDSLP